MSEADGTYKQFGGIDDTGPNTLVVDTLIANEVNAASNPTGLPDDVLIWVKEQGVSAEVHTLASYNIGETIVNPSLGDIAGNGANITGIITDASTTNLWDGGTNRNLRLVEISGGVVQGDVLNNKRADYTHAFVHGTMNTASGDFVHVHGRGNKVEVDGELFTHIEGSGNICDASYAHILGANNNVVGVSGGMIRVYGDAVTNAAGYAALIEGKEITVTSKGRYSYGYGEAYPSNNATQGSQTGRTEVTLSGTLGYNTNNGEGLRINMRIMFADANDNGSSGQLYNFITYQYIRVDASGNPRHGHGSAIYNQNTTTYPTGFRIYMGSGGINANSFGLYGMKR